MLKGKKIFYSLALVPLIVIVGLFVWFFAIVFEGEKPSIKLEPLPEYLSGKKQFSIDITDKKRGLKALKVSLTQEGRERIVLQRKFPFKGFLNRDGIHQFSQEIVVDPAIHNLAQGLVDLDVRVWDYSRRGGGDGNLALMNHKMTVDTLPPVIRAVSRMHNINEGGTGLLVYQTSSDTQKSGVYVEDLFFPGYPVQNESKKGIHVAYFAIPYDAKPNPSIYQWAKDRAGNLSTSSFYYHIRNRHFRHERINITDKFLKRVLPYFSFYPLDGEESDIEKFLKINNELRKESDHVFLKLVEKTSPKRLWEGPWLRLENAATMSRFADQRSYYYKGKKIDEQVHLGIDLASLANSPVQAANHGHVLFAERLGIYGLTVILDHGQGLMSLYGHLSQIKVAAGADVKRGDIIGITGQTGLAGGDHLHFEIMVSGTPVNPIEWWDSHWINDNVTRKLALLKE